MRAPVSLPAISVLSAILCLAITGCGGKATNVSTGPIVLKGAGATAPFPAYSKWFETYHQTDPAVELKYTASGSADGLHELEAGTVDFAASDIPLTDEEMGKMSVKPLHFPTLVGAVVPVYNVPNVSDLRFSGVTLAGIFSGRIKTWNDPAIVRDNPEAKLPADRIAVIHRGDGSGSTYAFTDYLSQVNESWKKNIGKGATVAWPVGQAATGSHDLAEKIKATKNSIGYVELNYATEAKLSSGAVKNASGQFQKATLEALGVAESSATNLSQEFRASLVNSKSKGAYPIATLTWLIVPSKITDGSKQAAMRRFLRWAYTDGIKSVMSMDYGILSPNVLEAAQAQVENIRYQ